MFSQYLFIFYCCRMSLSLMHKKCCCMCQAKNVFEIAILPERLMKEAHKNGVSAIIVELERKK